MTASARQQSRGRALSAIIVAVAALAVAVSFGVMVAESNFFRSDLFAISAFFFAVMYLGEILRLGGLGARGLSPIAVAGAVGFALVFERPEGRDVLYGAPPVILLACLALLLGVATRRRMEHRVERVPFAPYAIRLLAIGLIAVLFREVTLFGGVPLMTRDEEWANQPWRMAIVMIVITLIAHVLEVLAQVTLRSTQSGRSWLKVLREDLREMVPPSLAAISTGIVIALGVRTLDLFAVPLFLVPLLLMRFAMRRQQRTVEARRESMAALSRLTDLAGYTTPEHAKRVAALCTAVGRKMHLTDEELGDLASAALMHDIGQVMLNEPIPGGATVDVAPRDQERIAGSTAEIVRRTGAHVDVIEVVENQAVPFRRLVERGDKVSLSARILKVCNAYDDFTQGDPDLHDHALLRLRLGLGYEYDPRVVEVLALEVLRHEGGAAREDVKGASARTLVP